MQSTFNSLGKNYSGIYNSKVATLQWSQKVKKNVFGEESVQVQGR